VSNGIERFLLANAKDTCPPSRLVIRQFDQQRVDRHASGRGKPQCVAVGRSLGRKLVADDAAGAGAVIDNDRLSLD
jgi:hypothetical protein